MSTTVFLDRRPPSRHFRLKRVLVADRDAVWGTQMREALEGFGYYLNQISDPREARRRVRERVYDLVILSTTLGRAALEEIFAEMAELASPPQVILLAGAGEACRYEDPEGIPSLTLLRYPLEIDDVVYVSKALLGSAWEDDRLSS